MTVTYFLHSRGLPFLALLACVCAVGHETKQKKVCRYLGNEFNINELVTGDPCDRCICTQYGIMCEMVQCPKANCHDKVWNQCCFECPNGPNCLYEGENSTVLVPEEGCSYSVDVVCFCYRDNSKADKGETICMPAFPGESRSACKALEP